MGLLGERLWVLVPLKFCIMTHIITHVNHGIKDELSLVKVKSYQYISFVVQIKKNRNIISKIKFWNI